MPAVKDPKELADITFHGGFVRHQAPGGKLEVTRPQTYKLQFPTNSQEAAQKASGDVLALKARRVALASAAPLYSLPGGKELNSGEDMPKQRTGKLACLGIPSQILDNGSPAYSRCVRLASSYKKQRQKELTIAHGYVSSAVSALLAASSLALSASRFLYEIASGAEIFATESTPRGQLTMPQVLKLASSLSDSARQNELAAWELCARESVVFKRNKDSNQMSPWLVQAPSGEVKRPVGRPRKVSVVEASNYEKDNQDA